MAPYRSRREEAARAAPTTGLVTDMVRQFADPYAFLRELVQNGIDAGATAIDVTIERLPEGLVATSVSDDGSGMTRAIIEGPLLTLFSSSKEGDSKKIGKYGVGFVSIFALDPEEVQVSTGRDGESWLLRLFRDHSYELEVGGPRTGSGTKVTLLTKLPEARFVEASAPTKAPAKDPWDMDPSELLAKASEMLSAALGEVNRAADAPPMPTGVTFDQHAALAFSALKTWCRHAQIPITITVIEPGAAEPRASARVDTPLAVEAAISVVETSEGEVIVAGVSAGSELVPNDGERAPEGERGASFAGFYNRGLTLFETDQALSEELRGIRFKVMSPHLQHTLSRDNVRRDDAFDRLLDKVRAIVRGPLPKRLVAEITRRAEIAAKGEDQSHYAALLKAAQTPALAIKPRDVALPLTNPMPGSHERSVRDVSSHLSRGDSVLTSKAPDALTAALAREVKLVIQCPDEHVMSALRWCSKHPVEEAHAVYALVRELSAEEHTAADARLCKEVLESADFAGQPVARVALCRLEGVGATLVAVVTPDGEPDGPRVYPLNSIRSWWRRWSRRRALLLNVDVETVDFARRRAASDPALAGHLLARSLLLRGGESISVSANEKLLAKAGGGAR